MEEILSGEDVVKSPAFQFYPADYLADEKVQLMTLEEEGAYLRSLAFCWREGSIPSDPQTLSRLIGKGCSVEIARVVQGCFNHPSKDASRMMHPRLECEREKQKQWIRKSSEGGKVSAEKRQKRAKESIRSEMKGGSSGVVEPKVNSSSSISSSISISKYLPSEDISSAREKAELIGNSELARATPSALARFEADYPDSAMREHYYDEIDVWLQKQPVAVRSRCCVKRLRNWVRRDEKDKTGYFRLSGQDSVKRLLPPKTRMEMNLEILGFKPGEKNVTNGNKEVLGDLVDCVPAIPLFGGDRKRLG